MRSTIRWGVVAALLGVAAPTPAAAWCRMTTSRRAPTPSMPCVTEGTPLAWKRRCTSYAIGNAGSRDLPMDDLRRVLEASFAAWENVMCAGAAVGLEARQLDDLARCDTPEIDLEGGNANIIAFVEDWPDRGHDSSVYALTTVWHNTTTGEILDVDMEVNERRGPYGECPDTGCSDGTVDLANVMTHEVGHYFGIAHSPDTPLATMYAVAPAGEVLKRTLDADDEAALCAAYPAGSLPMACDDTPRGGLDLRCESGDGDDGGCAVRASRRGPGALASLAFGAVAALIARVGRRRRAR